MKVNYADYVKKSDVSVLVAEAIFSELFKSSPIKKIGDIAGTSSGGTPLRGNIEFYNGDIPWLKSGELNDGYIECAEEFISEKGLSNSSARLHPEGTLLLAMYGATAGKTGITKIKAATNQAVCALFPKEEISRDYLYWFLRQHRYKFIEISKGGAQPNISQTVIKDTKLPVPAKLVQEDIVSVLTAIQEKGALDLNIIPIEYRDIIIKVFYSKQSVTSIETENTQQLDHLKKLRQQILQDAVQGKLVLQDPNDETASELLERIKSEKEQLISEKKIRKEKPLPEIKPDEIPFEIPKNWVWCRLGDMSINRDEERNPISQIERERREKIYDYYGASGIIDKIDGFTHNGVYLLIGEDGANLKMKSTPIAFIAKGKFWVNNHAHVLDFIDSITMIYMENCLNGIDINGFITGGFQPKLSQGNLNIIPIPLPPLSEQHRIVDKIQQLMKLCDELEQSIKQNQKYTKELLQVALKEALEN